MNPTKNPPFAWCESLLKLPSYGKRKGVSLFVLKDAVKVANVRDIKDFCEKLAGPECAIFPDAAIFFDAEPFCGNLPGGGF